MGFQLNTTKDAKFHFIYLAVESDNAVEAGAHGRRGFRIVVLVVVIIIVVIVLRFYPQSFFGIFLSTTIATFLRTIETKRMLAVRSSTFPGCQWTRDIGVENRRA